ncbi:MAG: RnfABCDGE type electron transport complex subunit D [Hominisplanchenecus sp.]
MSEMLNISSNPHIRDSKKSSDLMLLVLIALLPASVFGVWHFGMRALGIIVISVASCVLTEYIYEKLMHRKVTIFDFSAAVTGLLLALNLPVSVPWWLPIIGSVFAIIFVKQLFGGLGQNFMNPALAARCFLLISFTGRMTDFTYDGITGATPLAAMKAGESVNLVDLFVGNTAGTIGETSVIAILIGAAILLIFKVIDLRIPASYLITFAIFTLIFGGHGFDLQYLAAQLCGGGLMLGAFFMATDYVTSPITKKGQIVYGCVIGILTGIFRFFGSASEGVSYAIILSNLLVPLIEKVTPPTAFGKGGKKHE